MNPNFKFWQAFASGFIMLMLGVMQALGVGDPTDDPVFIVRHSDLILQGQVMEIRMERDEHNVQNQVIVVSVKDIIVGKFDGGVITLCRPLFVHGDIGWVYPEFESNDEVILFLAASGKDLWIPIGGQKGKFTITGSTVEGSTIPVAAFKEQIKDVATFKSAYISFPPRRDIQGGQYISKLSGEFTIIDPSIYGPLQGTTIEFRLNPSDALDKNGNPISFDALRSAIQRALDTWNNSPHSYATFTISSTPYSGSRSSGNGVSTITFEELPYNGATDLVHYGIIDEVDIWFSKGYTDGEVYRSLRWNTDITYPSSYPTYPCPYPSWVCPGNHPPIGPVDLEDVAAHELGHGVGLGHVDKSGYTMQVTNYDASKWWEKTWRRSLENGDKAGKSYQDPYFPSAATQLMPKMLLSAPSLVNFGGTFTEPSGYYLEVESGKTFKFSSGIGITINGTLQAVGTSSQNSTFDRSGSSDWYGIVFNSSSGSSSQINYATIKNADYGVLINGASPTVSNTKINYCDIGAYLSGGSPKFSGLERISLFQKGMIFLFDVEDGEAAGGAFAELQAKYPDDLLVVEAQRLLGQAGQHISQKPRTASSSADRILVQNFPNPFNPSTKIRFTLPEAAHVQVVIYNIAGQKIRKLVDREFVAGQHAISWDGQDESGLAAASGIYFLRFQTVNNVKVSKLTLVR